MKRHHLRQSVATERAAGTNADVALILHDPLASPADIIRNYRPAAAAQLRSRRRDLTRIA